MFFKQNNEQHLKELILKNERLTAQTEELLKELEVSKEQLATYISDPDNFSEKNWEELQQLQKELNERLETQLANIPDPLKAKQTRTDLNPGSHWLPVR